MKEDLIEQEIRKWEKAFEKKMNNEEKVMFRWGLVYGVERAVKEFNKRAGKELI